MPVEGPETPQDATGEFAWVIPHPEWERAHTAAQEDSEMWYDAGAGQRFRVPMQNNGERDTEASGAGRYWVLVKDKVAFTDNFQRLDDMAFKLAQDAGLSNHEALRLRHKMMLGVIDDAANMAYGEMKNGYPVIHGTNVDRNWVYDQVMERQQNRTAASIDPRDQDMAEEFRDFGNWRGSFIHVPETGKTYFGRDHPEIMMDSNLFQDMGVLTPEQHANLRKNYYSGHGDMGITAGRTFQTLLDDHSHRVVPGFMSGKWAGGEPMFWSDTMSHGHKELEPELREQYRRTVRRHYMGDQAKYARQVNVQLVNAIHDGWFWDFDGKKSTDLLFGTGENRPVPDLTPYTGMQTLNAHVDGQIVGSIDFTPEKSGVDIASIYVIPEYRNSNVFQEIMKPFLNAGTISGFAVNERLRGLIQKMQQRGMNVEDRNPYDLQTGERKPEYTYPHLAGDEYSPDNEPHEWSGPTPGPGGVDPYIDQKEYAMKMFGYGQPYQAVHAGLVRQFMTGPTQMAQADAERAAQSIIDEVMGVEFPATEQYELVKQWDQPSGDLWPDTLPWGEAEQNYYRFATAPNATDMLQPGDRVELPPWDGTQLGTVLSIERTMDGDPEHCAECHHEPEAHEHLGTPGCAECYRETDDHEVALHEYQPEGGETSFWAHVKKDDGQTVQAPDSALRFVQGLEGSLMPDTLPEGWRMGGLIEDPIRYNYIPLTQQELDSSVESGEFESNANTMNLRAKRAGLPGRVRAPELMALYHRYDGKCAYCGQPFTDDNSGMLTFDHVLPIQEGGDNTISNVLPCHARCNAGLNKWQMKLNPMPVQPQRLEKEMGGWHGWRGKHPEDVHPFRESAVPGVQYSLVGPIEPDPEGELQEETGPAYRLEAYVNKEYAGDVRFTVEDADSPAWAAAPAAGPHIWIVWMWTEPKYRNAGLMTEAMNELKRRYPGYEFGTGGFTAEGQGFWGSRMSKAGPFPWHRDIPRAVNGVGQQIARDRAKQEAARNGGFHPWWTEAATSGRAARDIHMMNEPPENEPQKHQEWFDKIWSGFNHADDPDNVTTWRNPYEHWTDPDDDDMDDPNTLDSLDKVRMDRELYEMTKPEKPTLVDQAKGLQQALQRMPWANVPQNVSVAIYDAWNDLVGMNSQRGIDRLMQAGLTEDDAHRILQEVVKFAQASNWTA